MQQIFRTTMAGLETGLRVSQITTFRLVCCLADDDAGDVLRDPERSEFDQIPVRHKSHIIGVLERDKLFRGNVRECMKPLDDSLLVSADEPLTRFVPLLNKRPYRLVLVGTDIKGVVTRSDVAKAPVRDAALREYRKASKKLAKKRKLIRAPRQYSAVNLDWFVLYQFAGRSSSEIGNRKPAMVRTILAGIKAAAELLGWNQLRKIPRGRPKKPSLSPPESRS